MHPRIWLLACMWCLMVWTTPAQASWEAYQQAGEAAYSRGDYSAAQRMFLAAVREARGFGPQDPRLDISLNKLALLRVARGSHGKAGIRAQAGKNNTTRKPGAARRGRWRQPARTVLRRAKPGRQEHALLPVRSGERRRGTRTSMARQERHAKRPRAMFHRTRPTRRAAPPVRRGKRRAAIRTPRRAVTPGRARTVAGGRSMTWSLRQ